MEDPQNGFQVLHTLWTAIITVAGGIVAFFTKRLVDEVDKKADQYEVDELKQEVRDFIQRQDVQHASNTQRLDRILIELNRRNS